MAKNHHYIIFTEFVYVRLQILIWVGNGLMESTNLSKDAGDLLKNIYEDVDENKPIVIDCKGVLSIIDHSWDLLFQSIQLKKRQVIFINHTSLDEKISYSAKEFVKGMIITTKLDECIIKDQSSHFDFSKTHRLEINTVVRKTVESYIINSFCIHPSTTLLSSTPFKANGEYDANKIISNTEKFIWTCLAFADFIEATIQNQQIGSAKYPLRLLSVSLRSAPFVAAISLILRIPFLTIEHLGPQRQYLSPIKNSSDGLFEYVYVGDFSFGGTEIRITKMYTHFSGSKLNHAFVLGSIFEGDRFKDFHLHSYADLHELNKVAEYSVF